MTVDIVVPVSELAYIRYTEYNNCRALYGGKISKETAIDVCLPHFLRSQSCFLQEVQKISIKKEMHYGIHCDRQQRLRILFSLSLKERSAVPSPDLWCIW